MTDMIEKCAAAAQVKAVRKGAWQQDSVCGICYARAVFGTEVQHAPDCCHDIVNAVLDAGNLVVLREGLEFVISSATIEEAKRIARAALQEHGVQEVQEVQVKQQEHGGE